MSIKKPEGYSYVRQTSVDAIEHDKVIKNQEDGKGKSEKNDADG